LDPNKANPPVRLSNAQYNSADELISSKLSLPNSGYVFGNSNLHTLEFAEEFTVENEVEVIGCYLIVPNMSYGYTSGVEISLYSGASFPETLLQSSHFSPQYLDYNMTSEQFSGKNKNLSFVATESFVLFDDAVKVQHKFFISYKVNFSESSGFCVYNTKFENNAHPNTAWLKLEEREWMAASGYDYYKNNTSLAIHALVRETSLDSIIRPLPESQYIYYDRQRKALFLSKAESKPVFVEIYSVTGQLLEKTKFDVGQISCVLSEKEKEIIGIVRAVSANNCHSIKIIY
jgi:hypothetical protein